MSGISNQKLTTGGLIKIAGAAILIISHTVGVMSWINNRFQEQEIAIVKIQSDVAKNTTTLNEHSEVLKENIKINSELKTAIVELRITLQQLKEQANKTR